ncbi:TetR/AcrR family transcriptional regulator [Homoserinimonas sp. A447]
MTVTDDGLRARKQRTTREAIHRIAVRRALADGPQSVTAAEISAEAGVSARTFFNYFPSKEDAMLGFHEALPTDDELEEFTASTGTDLLHELVLLMRNVFSSSPTDHHIMRDRRELLRQHPELLQRQMARVFAVEQRIVPVVAQRMRTLATFADVTDHEASAQMLVMLATSSIRIAIRNVTQSPDLSSTDADDDRALEASLSTLREVAARIQ